jgi:predicted ATP-binding protein involved in virulence
MWIEEVTLENVKCFQSQTIRLGKKDEPHQWVTFLGENGTGKTTVLQAIGLLLAGIGTAKILLPDGKASGWAKGTGNPNGYGRLSAVVQQGSKVKYGDQEGTVPDALDVRWGLLKTSHSQVGTLKFDLAYIVNGPKSQKIQDVEFEENSIEAAIPVGIINRDEYILKLRYSVHINSQIGWFSVGYSSFRRLSKEGAFSSRRPDFEKRENFHPLFKEEPIDSFNSWLMYLDHFIAKTKDKDAIRHLEITKTAINSLLPEGYTVEGADIDGKIWFNTPQGRISTNALSDGFRSILSLAGDLIWRMIQAWPEGKFPLDQQGIVLIDELDIHLHPKWQRSIAGLLRKTFPNIQFIVATHSPIVAAGAGSDAVTYGFYQEGDQTKVERIEHIWAQSVDDILKSKAFELVSEFSEETQTQIDRYFELKRKRSLNSKEQKELEATYPFVREALGPGMGPSDIQLEIEALLKEKFK